MGMPILYVRSSSLGNWEFCNMQYFITYNLGWQAPANKKANLGSITHKVLELLANFKLCVQNEKRKSYNYIDKEVGEFNFTSKSMMTTKLVEELLNRCYIYYTENTPDIDYTRADFKFCEKMVDACLVHNDGQFDPRQQHIVAPEKSFDLEINEPWARVLYNGEVRQLRIKGTMDLVTSPDPGVIEYIDYKGLALDTKIPTPNGWTTMGEIKVGDSVFDANGKQCKVVGKSNIKNLNCYKIHFDDKSTVTCDEEHLWVLMSGDVVNVKDLKHKDKIALTKPLDLEDADLPIDPYLLGLWLADGRNRTGEISKPDNFIFEEILKRGYSIGADISCRNNGCQSRTVYDLVGKLKSLNLLHNKHIPIIYLRASYKQRLDLLRGLMDGDGSVNELRKSCVFSNCNKKLSEDVKELALTLGQRAHLCPIKANGFGKIVDAFHVSFRPIGINPFLLPRKAEKIKPEWGSGDSNRRLIKNIEQIESIETQCIKVDSETSTFLCTENMIPTHNTGARKNWATDEEKTYAKLHDDIQLLLYFYALRKLYPEYKHIIMTIFYLRDGGPFSLCFDDSDEIKFLKKLEEKFVEIKNCNYPKPINKWRSGFKCEKLCHYYKTNWPGTDKSMCCHAEDTIKTYGIENAINKLSRPGFTIDFYSAPGAINNADTK